MGRFQKEKGVNQAKSQQGQRSLAPQMTAVTEIPQLPVYWKQVRYDITSTCN